MTSISIRSTYEYYPVNTIDRDLHFYRSLGDGDAQLDHLYIDNVWKENDPKSEIRELFWKERCQMLELFYKEAKDNDFIKVATKGRKK